MNIRKANIEDLPAIIALLADDELGSTREKYENPLPEDYVRAFHVIDNDPNQELVVSVNEVGMVIGTMQITFIQYLNYQGGARAQIESVQIHSQYRGGGLGKEMIEWAIDLARSRGVKMVQLTSDKRRPRAIKFYESLGFTALHEGMKLHLG